MLLSRLLTVVKSSVVVTKLVLSKSVLFLCARLIPTAPAFSVFEHKAQYYIQLSCTFKNVNHNIQFSQQLFWIQSFYGKVVYCVSSILHLTVNQKLFRRSQFFFQAFVFNVSITCATSTFWAPELLCAPFSFRLRSGQFLKAVKDFVACLVFLNHSSRYFRVFFGNVIIHVSSGFCRKVGARRAYKGPSWTSRLVSYKVPLCSLCPTIFTKSYFEAVETNYISKMCIRD